MRRRGPDLPPQLRKMKMVSGGSGRRRKAKAAETPRGKQEAGEGVRCLTGKGAVEIGGQGCKKQL